MSDPTAKSLDAIHNSIIRLLLVASDIRTLLANDLLPPNWEEVDEVFTRLGQVRERLGENQSAFAHFDGLRPDGVVIGGVSYRSWHRAFAEMYANTLGLWLGEVKDKDLDLWVPSDLVDWTDSLLALKVIPGRDYCRSRDVVWNRLRTMAQFVRCDHTNPLIYLIYRTEFSGWLNLALLDAWTHLNNLRSECDHARRQLDLPLSVGRPNPSKPMQPGDWKIVFGLTANLTGKRLAEMKKKGRARDLSQRRWIVDLNELSSHEFGVYHTLLDKAVEAATRKRSKRRIAK